MNLPLHPLCIGLYLDFFSISTFSFNKHGPSWDRILDVGTSAGKERGVVGAPRTTRLADRPKNKVRIGNLNNIIGWLESTEGW
jgi:hypothetical protein